MVMRRLFITLILVPFIALLAGCVMFRPLGSWVELRVESDAAPLAEAIVVFVAQSISEPNAAIALADLPQTQLGNPLTRQVEAELTGRGYRLAPQASHHLCYWVSQYGDQILLRVTLDATEIAVLFDRDESRVLHAATPLSMRRKGRGL
jgi:hypothetical protein